MYGSKRKQSLLLLAPHCPHVEFGLFISSKLSFHYETLSSPVGLNGSQIETTDHLKIETLNLYFMKDSVFLLQAKVRKEAGDYPYCLVSLGMILPHFLLFSPLADTPIQSIPRCKSRTSGIELRTILVGKPWP